MSRIHFAVSSNNSLKEIAIGALLITIVGLVFMLAFAVYVIETGTEEPVRMFPLRLLSTISLKIWLSCSSPFLSFTRPADSSGEFVF